MTGSSGAFLFSGLLTGTYRIREVLPAGEFLTTPSLGYYDVSVTSGQQSSPILFGDALITASISGTVFDDVNSNGNIDPGELGLGLWTVSLDYTSGILKGKVVNTTTTANGDFVFANLLAGSYTLSVIPPVPGTSPTLPTGGSVAVTLTPGQLSASHLFGER